MLPQYTIIKLRNNFVRKIREEWVSKWEVKFGKLGTNEPFPTSDKFMLALVDDIIDSIPARGLSAKELEDFVPTTYTLKRNLKTENDDGMRENTRECLALYLGYKNFADFVKSINLETPILGDKIIVENLKLSKQKKYKWVAFGVFISLLAVIFIIWNYTQRKILIKPRITNIHLNSKKAPITAKIEYDLGNMSFDSAYLDFEWKDRIGIDKQKKAIFFCFLHPTRRIAKLMVDGKCVDSTQIVIPSDGWMMGYESIYYVDKKKWHKNNFAHLAAEDVVEEFKKKGYYNSFIKNVGGFNGINGDDFSFETRFKNPKAEGTTSCSDATVTLVGSKNKLLLNLTQKGCSFFSYVKLNHSLLGQVQDFQNLSINLNEFIKLNIKTNNQKIEIFIDDKLAFFANNNKKLGNLEAINIDFQNSGSVDYVKGTNSSSRKLLFFDDFDK